MQADIIFIVMKVGGNIMIMMIMPARTAQDKDTAEEVSTEAVTGAMNTEAEGITEPTTGGKMEYLTRAWHPRFFLKNAVLT